MSTNRPKSHRPPIDVSLATSAAVLAAVITIIYLVWVDLESRKQTDPNWEPVINPGSVSLIVAALITASAGFLIQRFAIDRARQRQAWLQLYEMKVEAFKHFIEVFEWYHSNALTVASLRLYVLYFPGDQDYNKASFPLDDRGLTTQVNAKQRLRDYEKELRNQPSLDAAKDMLIANISVLQQDEDNRLAVHRNMEAIERKLQAVTTIVYKDLLNFSAPPSREISKESAERKKSYITNLKQLIEINSGLAELEESIVEQVNFHLATLRDQLGQSSSY